MKRSKINPISDKKAAEIREETKIRAQLADRCQGKCEECGEPAYWPGLSPHEKVFRSHGGHMSLENSLMLCITCHSLRHGIRTCDHRHNASI
jgi:5-methylcytosine-specific restriction endonuclease McrA